MNIQAEKLELIQRIIRTDDEAILEQVKALLEESIPATHRAILDERLAAHQADPQAGEDWETIQARIKGKL
jgi:hypothetical protein